MSPVAVFAALGDPTRHRLLELLAGQEQSSAVALAERLAVSRQAVEKQLRILQDVGLVRAHRSGRRVAYAVRADTLERSSVWLRDLARAWDEQLAAAKQLAESED